MRFSLNTIGLFPGLSFEQIFPRMRQSGFDTFELWSLENVDTAALRQAMERLSPQQRAAVARALITHPQLVLADEPTGALDSHTGREVLTMLQQLHAAGNTVVLITHNSALTAMADRVISIKSGTIQSVRKNEHVTPVEEIEW